MIWWKESIWDELLLSQFSLLYLLRGTVLKLKFLINCFLISSWKNKVKKIILIGWSAYRLADNGDLRSKLVELTAELNAEKAEARLGRPPIRPQSGKLWKTRVN